MQYFPENIVIIIQQHRYHNNTIIVLFRVTTLEYQRTTTAIAPTCPLIRLHDHNTIEHTPMQSLHRRRIVLVGILTERFRQRLGPPWGSPCLQGVPYYSTHRCVAPNSTSSNLLSLPMKSLVLCTASSYAYSTATPSYAHQRAIDLGTLSTPPPLVGESLPSILTYDPAGKDALLLPLYGRDWV